MPSTFGVVQDRYVLEEIVGSGGMGVVYRARDKVLGRAVAVKVIRQELVGEEFIKRFEREASILARLRSPHIVVVYDYGKHEDQFFMVTDFLTEGDLAGWLENNGPMPVIDAVSLVSGLADGLADAHELGVLHRDIKPANVLLWKRGGRLHPVLADFGIAVTSDLTLTKTGAVVGSPLYMAPERHLGQPATNASDIYSMGCLLYALVTGAPPYWGTEFQAASAHLNSPIPHVPADVPHALEVDRVIAACMAKDPTARISSADELSAMLRQLADRMSGPSVVVEPPTAERVPAGPPVDPPVGAATVLSPTDPPPAPGQAEQTQGRRRWLVPALVAAVVGVVAAGTWWLAAGDDEPEASDQPTVSAPTTEGSDEVEPPARPPRPRIETERLDLAVAFTTALPPRQDGVTYEVERKDSGWSPSRARVELSTDQGGEPQCVTLRFVAVNAAGRTAGPARQECDRALPRKLELLPVPVECQVYDHQCTYYQLLVEGFPPREALVVVCRLPAELTLTDEERRARQIIVYPGEDGKAAKESFIGDDGVSKPGAFALDDVNDVVLCDAGGKTWRFDLVKLRAQV